MQATRELRALTGLRGFAAAHVMLYHFASTPRRQGSHNPLVRLLAQGYLEVDLFFVLSGFVLALNYSSLFGDGLTAQNYLKFLGRRIARIYPLYLLATLIAAYAISVHWMRGLVTPGGLLANVLMVQSWGISWSFDLPAWSLSAEWAACLLFPVLVIVCLSKRRSLSVAYWLLCAALTLLLVDRADMLFRFNGLWPVARCLLDFSQGLLAYRVYRNGRTSYKILAAAPLLAILLVAVFREQGLAILLFPAIILFLTDERTAIARFFLTRPLAYLGRLSFGIYLNHLLFPGFMTYVHAAVEAHGFHNGHAAAVLLAIPLTLVFSELTYRYVEIPGREWLRKRFEDKDQPSALPQVITRDPWRV